MNLEELNNLDRTIRKFEEFAKDEDRVRRSIAALRATDPTWKDIVDHLSGWHFGQVATRAVEYELGRYLVDALRVAELRLEVSARVSRNEARRLKRQLEVALGGTPTAGDEEAADA